MSDKRKLQLWYIHGKAYDLVPWTQQHPGGAAILNMVKGLNSTELFETYHFRKKPPPELMAKYEVKIDPSTYTAEEKSKLLDERFYFEEDGFYADVKKRVQKHFQEKRNLSQSHIVLSMLASSAIYRHCYYYDLCLFIWINLGCNCLWNH
jgi:hypothetical protein